MPPIRILLVDDHRIVREGLASMLSTQPDMLVVGEAGTGAEAIVQVVSLQPDIVLLDLEMPDLDGVNVLERVRGEFPGVRVRCGAAIHLDRILGNESMPRFYTVVSSLPLSNLAHEDRIRNVRAMIGALVPEGPLIQYTDAAGCPIPSRRLGLEAECLGHVWRNLPPAAVWSFKVKQSAPPGIE